MRNDALLVFLQNCYGLFLFQILSLVKKLDEVLDGQVGAPAVLVNAHEVCVHVAETVDEVLH